MPSALFMHPRFPRSFQGCVLRSTPQLLYPQYFACNPFIFIDLAGTPQLRPNQFIDLRGNAIFFQE